VARPRNKIVDYLQYLGVRLFAMFVHMFPWQANYNTARIIGNLLYRFARPDGWGRRSGGSTASTGESPSSTCGGAFRTGPPNASSASHARACTTCCTWLWR